MAGMSTKPTVADLPWRLLPEPLTTGLAHWAHDLSYRDLGREVREAVVRLCRDFVVISLAASTGRGVGESSGPGLEPLIKLAALHRGPCTILGRGVTTTPQHAAIVNGAFAHTLNLMDVHRWSAPTHICPGVFPAVFALAQTRPVAFPEFAEAVVAGVEGIAKLGMALNVGKGVIDTTDANSSRRGPGGGQAARTRPGRSHRCSGYRRLPGGGRHHLARAHLTRLLVPAHAERLATGHRGNLRLAGSGGTPGVAEDPGGAHRVPQRPKPGSRPRSPCWRSVIRSR